MEILIQQITDRGDIDSRSSMQELGLYDGEIRLGPATVLILHPEVTREAKRQMDVRGTSGTNNIYFSQEMPAELTLSFLLIRSIFLRHERVTAQRVLEALKKGERGCKS